MLNRIPGLGTPEFCYQSKEWPAAVLLWGSESKCELVVQTSRSCRADSRHSWLRVGERKANKHRHSVLATEVLNSTPLLRFHRFTVAIPNYII